MKTLMVCVMALFAVPQVVWGQTVLVDVREDAGNYTVQTLTTERTAAPARNIRLASATNLVWKNSSGAEVGTTPIHWQTNVHTGEQFAQAIVPYLPGVAGVEVKVGSTLTNAHADVEKPTAGLPFLASAPVLQIPSRINHVYILEATHSDAQVEDLRGRFPAYKAMMAQSTPTADTPVFTSAVLDRMDFVAIRARNDMECIVSGSVAGCNGLKAMAEAINAGVAFDEFTVVVNSMAIAGAASVDSFYLVDPRSSSSAVTFGAGLNVWLHEDGHAIWGLLDTYEMPSGVHGIVPPAVNCVAVPPSDADEWIQRGCHTNPNYYRPREPDTMLAVYVYSVYSRIAVESTQFPHGIRKRVTNLLGPLNDPSTPQDFRATVSGTTVRFNWLPVAGASSYRLQAGSGPGLTSYVSSPIFNQGVYTVIGAPQGTHYVRLQANVAGVWSEPTSDITVTIGSPPPQPGPCTRPPSPPSGYDKVTNTDGVTTVSWNPVDDLMYFQVSAYRGSELLVGPIVQRETRVSGRVPSGTYRLLVRVTTGCGEAGSDFTFTIN